MPQIINTNIASINAQRNLDKSQSSNQQALQRLSSGLRINSAKDDAAGLAISTRFTSQIKGLNVAVRNAGDGIALAQTAEGALGSINENLQRIRELAVQSANATNSDVDRDALQSEVDQLIAQVATTAEDTDFNGRKLLDGSFSATFQVGANAGQTVDVSISELTVDKLGASDASGLSSVGTSSGLENGDLIINNVAISPSKAEDDTSSSINKEASAISKAAAINSKSDQTGVTAFANENTAAGSEQVGAAETGTLTLNGVAISLSTSTDESGSRASVVAAINAVSDQTGITAEDSGTAANGVNLSAADGRNIDIAFSGFTSDAIAASSTGLAAEGTYYSGVTLVADGDVSSIDISGGDGTGNGNLANAGLQAGSYDSGSAQLASTAVTSAEGVGFQSTSLAGASGDIFGLSGGIFSTDQAARASGTSGITEFGTTAETLTFTGKDGETTTFTATAADTGADGIATALNSLTGVSASAETRVELNFTAAVGAGVLTTTASIEIYDTSTTGGASITTISFSSGQSLDQVATAINGAGTSIVATVNTTANTIQLTDTAGNTLAFSGTSATTAITAAAISREGTTGATANVNGTGSVYVVGYVKDVNITDSEIDSVGVSSSRQAGGTVAASTLLSRGSGAIATLNSVDVSAQANNYGLEDGDIILNGVSIKAADPGTDTASALAGSDGSVIQTSIKEKSAIAVAAAINDVSGETGVKAEANETVLVGSQGSTYDANVTAARAIYDAGDSGKMYINGVDIGVISLVDDGTGTVDLGATRQTAIDLINQKAGQTGVTAEDNGESITLRAADGRNVSVAIDNDNANNQTVSSTSSGFGALVGLDATVNGVGEADIGTGTADNVVGARGAASEGATYETTYGTVSLTSAKQIDLEAGTRGKDELESLGLTAGTFGGGEDGQFLSEIDISTVEGATAALTAIDNAIGQVASQRADLGAVQNRLESTVSNLQVTSENLNAANSRIQDADFAAETAELQRTNVLQQAGISVLAQANAAGQQVLSLLG
jgi:flagellin